MTAAGTTAAAIVAAGMSTLVAGIGWTTPTQDATGTSGTTQTADRAFEELSSCVSSDDTEEVAALFLVDESASLQFNDPDDLRVDAIEAAVVSLEDLADQLGDKQVTALGATFAEGYTVRRDWTDVSTGASGLSDYVAQVGELENGRGTNYVAALAGARDSFQGRSQACKVLYWFTDGKLDMDFAGAEQTNSEAWQSLSEEQGLIDAIRAEGITVIALPLFDPDAPPELLAGPGDRARLQALAEGIGAFDGVTEEAGTITSGQIPSGVTPGAYLESGDPSVLSSYFSYAVSRSAGFTDVQAIACPSPDCPAGRLPVPVEPGITRTQVLLVADEEPGAVTVGDHNSRPLLSANPGEDVSDNSGTAQVSITWSGLLARIDIVTDPDGEAAGEWTVETDPQRPSRATVLMQSGLQIALPGNRPPLIAGEAANLELSVAYPDGSPVDPSVFADWSVEAGLSDRLSPATASGPSTYAVEVQPDRDSSTAALTTNVQITTTNGYALDPLSPTFTLPVAPPDGFPRVESLTFPDAVGVTPITGTLVLQGADDSTTEVTLGVPTLESPDGAGPEALTLDGITPGQPITLQAGEPLEVQVTFSPVDSVDGLASGTLPVSLNSLQPGQPTLEQSVPFSIGMARPVDQAERALWVAVLAALSVLLPLLLLYLVARHVAQLQLPSGLFALTTPVVIASDGSVRSPSGAPLDSDPSDWQRPAAAKRRCTAGPLSVKTGVTRFLKPAVWADVRTGDVGSADSPHLGQRRGQAPADVNPHGAWYLCVTDSALHRRSADDADLPATLVAFTDVNQPDGSIGDANARFRAWSSGSRVIDQWLERLPATTGPSPSAPPDGGAPPPGHGPPPPDGGPPPDYTAPAVPTPPGTPPAPSWTGPAGPAATPQAPPADGPPKYV